MSDIAQSAPISAAQLAQLPDDGIRRELIDGEVIMMSPAGGRHGLVAANLARLLGNHAMENSLGRVFAAETGFLLSRNPDTVRAPDVAFVRQDRLDAEPDLTGFVPLAPDFVAEVISPNDRFSAVEAKAFDWLQRGVKAVLTVDPENRTARLYRSAKDQVPLDDADTLDLSDVVSAWKVELRELFA